MANRTGELKWRNKAILEVWVFLERAAGLSILLNQSLNGFAPTLSLGEGGGAAGPYLGELLGVGQVVHGDGQEDVQQSI